MIRKVLKCLRSEHFPELLWSFCQRWAKIRISIVSDTWNVNTDFLVQKNYKMCALKLSFCSLEPIWLWFQMTFEIPLVMQKEWSMWNIQACFLCHYHITPWSRSWWSGKPSCTDRLLTILRQWDPVSRNWHFGVLSSWLSYLLCKLTQVRLSLLLISFWLKYCSFLSGREDRHLHFPSK